MLFSTQAYIDTEDITAEDIPRLKESLTIVKIIIHKVNIGKPLGIQYFNAAPFLFGSDRVMKFSALTMNLLNPHLRYGQKVIILL